jgi:hypothetical protein
MMMQLLQGGFNKGPGANAAAAPDPAALMGILCFYGVVILLSLVFQIFFLMALSKCFKQISPRNRLMEPGQVWLNLVPFLNYVWLILTFLRLSDSLKNEFEDRGLRSEDKDYARTFGIITYVSLFVCGCVTPILIIIYWVKINGFTKQLIADGAPSSGKKKSRDDDYEDEDDDSPRRGR